MTPTVYQALRRTAARASAPGVEADDLVQNALEAALAARRDPSDPANLPWLKGVVRLQAKAALRAAARRGAREDEAGAMQEAQTSQPSAPEARLTEALDRLPGALRRTAVLALAGFTRDELRHVLGIGDAALRRRLSDLRTRMTHLEPPTDAGAASDLPLGRLRAALLEPVSRQGGLGAHDPDGHLFVVALTKPPPRTTEDADSKGDPA